MGITYVIHSAVRGRQTRTTRAMQAKHNRLKQYVGETQQRLLRGRPLFFSEEKFLRNFADIKAKAEAGILEVRTAEGQLIDLDTMQIMGPISRTPLPRPLLDSIANDRPWGERIPSFPGDEPGGSSQEPSLLTNLDRYDETDLHRTVGQDPFIIRPAPRVSEEELVKQHLIPADRSATAPYEEPLLDVPTHEDLIEPLEETDTPIGPPPIVEEPAHRSHPRAAHKKGKR